MLPFGRCLCSLVDHMCRSTKRGMKRGGKGFFGVFEEKRKKLYLSQVTDGFKSLNQKIKLYKEGKFKWNQQYIQRQARVDLLPLNVRNRADDAISALSVLLRLWSTSERRNPEGHGASGQGDQHRQSERLLQRSNREILSLHLSPMAVGSVTPVALAMMGL